mmetsp:Transcript_1680/g.3242  ORF Transcript_1680/g.3242 Transcript_1680/m.3242 type:complete len:82 (+) Transcript_1680:58-303(+)
MSGVLLALIIGVMFGSKRLVWDIVEVETRATECRGSSAGLNWNTQPMGLWSEGSVLFGIGFSGTVVSDSFVGDNDDDEYHM